MTSSDPKDAAADVEFGYCYGILTSASHVSLSLLYCLLSSSSSSSTSSNLQSLGLICSHPLFVSALLAGLDTDTVYVCQMRILT